jgi:hypothetical protein
MMKCVCQSGMLQKIVKTFLKMAQMSAETLRSYS